MSRYNFLMTIQGAKALKNPLNFLNTVIPPFGARRKIMLGEIRAMQVKM